MPSRTAFRAPPPAARVVGARPPRTHHCAPDAREIARTSPDTPHARRGRVRVPFGPPSRRNTGRDPRPEPSAPSEFTPAARIRRSHSGRSPTLSRNSSNQSPTREPQSAGQNGEGLTQRRPVLARGGDSRRPYNPSPWDEACPRREPVMTGSASSMWSLAQLGLHTPGVLPSNRSARNPVTDSHSPSDSYFDVHLARASNQSLARLVAPAT
jgi:hypothetical protein